MGPWDREGKTANKEGWLPELPPGETGAPPQWEILVARAEHIPKSSFTQGAQYLGIYTVIGWELPLGGITFAGSLPWGWVEEFPGDLEKALTEECPGWQLTVGWSSEVGILMDMNQASVGHICQLDKELILKNNYPSLFFGSLRTKTCLKSSSYVTLHHLCHVPGSFSNSWISQDGPCCHLFLPRLPLQPANFTAFSMAHFQPNGLGEKKSILSQRKWVLSSSFLPGSK